MELGSTNQGNLAFTVCVAFCPIGAPSGHLNASLPLVKFGVCSRTNSTDGKYHFYWSGPFSQWQRSEFEMDGRRFGTAEQAMMYFKAKLLGDDETAELIMQAVDPGRQKALGRRVKNFSDTVWNENKYEIVYRINLQKFSQNKGLRRKLFQTGERKLVEASPVDTIWGIGLEASVADVTPEADWPGRNLLGEILTKVRDDLKGTFPDEFIQVSASN